MAATIPHAAGKETVSIEPATEGDLMTLFEIINDAYSVETGDSGVAFKRTPRFLEPHGELQPAILSGRVLKAVDKATGAILGCISYQIKEDAVFFGPFAVIASAQGRGVGRQLMAAIDAIGKSHGCSVVEINVINLRTDIYPMYQKLGFKEVGVVTYPFPETLTRPCHLVTMRRPLVA